MILCEQNIYKFIVWCIVAHTVCVYVSNAKAPIRMRFALIIFLTSCGSISVGSLGLTSNKNNNNHNTMHQMYTLVDQIIEVKIQQRMKQTVKEKQTHAHTHIGCELCIYISVAVAASAETHIGTD